MVSFKLMASATNGIITRASKFARKNFEITDDIIIEDVLSMAGIEIEEDLLNRDGIEDSSDIKEFTDVIKKIYCLIHQTMICYPNLLILLF